MPGGRIQADERIVHDEDAGGGQQGFGELELAQLAATEQDELLAEQRFHLKQAEQLTGQLVVLGASQLLADDGGIVLVVGVPPLLVVIVGIGAAVGVAKGDVLDVVVDCSCGRGAEVVGQ